MPTDVQWWQLYISAWLAWCWRNVLLACFAFLLIIIINLLISPSRMVLLAWAIFWTFPGRILLGRQYQLNVMRNFQELSLWHDGGWGTFLVAWWWLRNILCGLTTIFHLDFWWLNFQTSELLWCSCGCPGRRLGAGAFEIFIFTLLNKEILKTKHFFSDLTRIWSYYYYTTTTLYYTYFEVASSLCSRSRLYLNATGGSSSSVTLIHTQDLRYQLYLSKWLSTCQKQNVTSKHSNT